MQFTDLCCSLACRVLICIVVRVDPVDDIHIALHCEISCVSKSAAEAGDELSTGDVSPEIRSIREALQCRDADLAEIPGRAIVCDVSHDPDWPPYLYEVDGAP